MVEQFINISVKKSVKFLSFFSTVEACALVHKKNTVLKIKKELFEVRGIS